MLCDESNPADVYILAFLALESFPKELMKASGKQAMLAIIRATFTYSSNSFEGAPLLFLQMRLRLRTASNAKKYL